MPDVLDEINFRIVDLSEPRLAAEIEVAPGFYYALLLDEEGNPISPDDNPSWRGPFDSRQEAIEDCRGFIRDALTEDHTEEEDQTGHA